MRQYPLEARSHNAANEPVPLTDQQLADFIAGGFLTLKSSLPKSYHQGIFERFDEISQSIGHFGNNLLPLVPELNELFEDPVIKGALQSVLGPEYSMHPHRALHSNPPGSDEQGFHKDSYWGYVRRVRNHRPWWVMIMYFPQDTPVEKGPTAVMSGSQHLNQHPKDYCNPVSISGEAGSFVLIHYDIWHRKMLNQTDMNRYMFKFEFVRLAQPASTGRGLWPGVSKEVTPNLEPAWKSVWSWLNGQPIQSSAKKDSDPDTSCLSDLNSPEEWRAIRASYEMGSSSSIKIAGELLEALEDNPNDYNEGRRYSDDGSIWREDAVPRNAAHALVNMGRPALDGLIHVLQNGNVRAQKHAAFAIGEIASQEGETALAEALNHEEVHVRVAATEALGLLPPTQTTAQAMLKALADPASEVRFDAALSLVRVASQTSCSNLMEQAIEPLGKALYDTNRYVSGYAADALERIGTPNALSELLPFLRTARWCAHTDNKRPF